MALRDSRVNLFFSVNHDNVMVVFLIPKSNFFSSFMAVNQGDLTPWETCDNVWRYFSSRHNFEEGDANGVIGERLEMFPHLLHYTGQCPFQRTV